MNVIELRRLLQDYDPGSEVYLSVACFFHDDGKLVLLDGAEDVVDGVAGSVTIRAQSVT